MFRITEYTSPILQVYKKRIREIIMKKILCICLILAMLTSIFAACGKDVSEPNDTDGGIATEAQTELSTDTEASTDTEGTGGTGDGQEPEIVLTEYSLDENAAKISETTQGIEFCVSYDKGGVWVTAKASNKTVKYSVYVDGKSAGTVVFSPFGTPVELPGTAEAAGEKVMIRLVLEDLDLQGTVKFRDICVSGTLESMDFEPEGEPMEYNISMNLNKFHVQGRSSIVNHAVTADWSASGIEFNATYIGSIYVSGQATRTVQFRVYVNGDETGVISFGTTQETKLLPGTLCMKETTAHIRLVRLEYVKDGFATLKTVLLNGTVHTWNEERKFVEFIGDSITCGYGSVTQDATKDGSRTFAYLTACEFGVDYSMVAISGIGISVSTDQHGGMGMGDFYKYLCQYRNSQTLYAPQKQADLVVVNLNTNDYANGATEDAYKEKLNALLADIRAIHGENVNIVWVTGQMIANNPVDGWLEEVFADLGGESAGLYIMETVSNRSGGDTHPNYANHKVTAEKLINFINDQDLL